MADSGRSPPPGGDEDKGNGLLIVGSIFATLSTLTVLLRVITRAVIVKSLGLDDLLIVLGAIFMIAVAVLGLYVVRYGIGRHQYYLLLTPGVLPEISKLSYIAEVLIICSVMFVRSSVAIFLFRIFGHRKGWKLMLYSVIFWILLSWVTALVFVLAACKPITKIWEPLSPGVCWDAKTTLITGAYIGAANALGDFLLAFLPIVFLWDVQMKIRTKVGICILMGMGVFTGICDIVRVVQLNNVDRPDFTWNGLDLYIWGFLEDTVGIIAACIPTLRPLFRHPASYFSSMKTVVNKVTKRPSKSQSEDTYHLNELSINMRPPSDSHASPNAKGGIGVEGGQWRKAHDDDTYMEWY